jgi:ABC-type siderophore export system fused ATPase/permease subunit
MTFHPDPISERRRSSQVQYFSKLGSVDREDAKAVHTLSEDGPYMSVADRVVAAETGGLHQPRHLQG